MVTGIVRARGDFIDEKLAVFGDEQFHAERSHIEQGIGHTLGEGDGGIRQGGRNAGGGDGEIEDVIAVDILAGGVGGEISTLIAGSNDGNFHGEVHPFLNHTTGGTEAAPDVLGIISGGQFDLTFAIVTKRSRLEHGRRAKLPHGLGKAGGGVHDAEFRVGETVLLEEIFLPFTMLGGFQGQARRKDRTALFHGLKKGTGNVFKFHRHHIRLLNELGRGLGIKIGGVDLAIRQLPGRTLRGFIGKNNDTIAVAFRLPRQHAPELTTANDAKRLSRL